jgi:hypothetical protein
MASLGALEETGPGHPDGAPRLRSVATEPWQMEAHELAAALVRRELSAVEALQSTCSAAPTTSPRDEPVRHSSG